MSEHAEKILSVAKADDDVSALATSWRRCVNVFGLHPDRDRPPDRDISGWRDACERDASMLHAARDYLDQIFRFFDNADYGVFLADRSGMVLDVRTSRAHDVWKRKPEHWLGSNYAESSVGTNGIGTCLAERRPVIVRAEDHFLTAYRNIVCISAPIFGPSGDLQGTLCVSAKAANGGATLDNFISATVGAWARRIEIDMFCRNYSKSRIMLASSDGRHPCALLAVDRDDCVIGATRGARRTLNLNDTRLMRGLSAADVLEPRQAATHATDLARSERTIIQRALGRNGGNMSAAAREIGISRNTMYRKLAGYRESSERR